MNHLLPLEEFPEFVALRADSQLLEKVGRFHCQHECAEHLAEGDVRYVFIAPAMSMYQGMFNVLNMLGMNHHGQRLYLWLRWDTTTLDMLGFYDSYVDAVQDAARRLISPQRGMVLDTQRILQWPLALRDAPPTQH